MNVRRIDGHDSSHPADSTFALIDLLDFLVVPAHAAGTDTAGEGSDMQGIQANPLYVLFVIAFNPALIPGSMFIGKKIVNNTRFVMFTGVCTLLIEGVVTEAGLWGWLEGIIQVPCKRNHHGWTNTGDAVKCYSLQTVFRNRVSRP